MQKIIFIFCACFLTHTSEAQWLTEGNTGTNPSTNFVGTIDNKGLVFRTNNKEAMRIASTGSLGIGIANPLQKLHVKGNINIDSSFALYMQNNPILFVDSLEGNTFLGNGLRTYRYVGRHNTSNGYYALHNSTGYIDDGYSGEDNTATGYLSLMSNTFGSLNTANGSYSLYLNTTGGSNTANGVSALYHNINGYLNTASGGHSLFSNISGLGNTAYGYAALFKNDGNANVAIGIGTLYNAVTQSFLVAVGDSALYNNGSALSYQAIGNTAVGSKSLFSNTTGTNNTGNGFQSLYTNKDGLNNTATGYKCLYLNNGSQNTANGSFSLYFNNTGYNNTANGYQSLFSNTTGANNTSNGFQSLYVNTIGIQNTAIGSYALYFSNGSSNTANGYKALYNNTGSENTGVGRYSLYSNTSGNRNTAVGVSADVGSGSLTNATAIGYNASVNASNKAVIGNTLVTSIGGYAGWTTYPSDGRYKKSIKQNVPGLAFINKLKPVTYKIDIDALQNVQNPAKQKSGGNDSETKSDDKISMADKGKINYTGFIAQDVEKAAKDVNYDFSAIDKSGEIWGLRYAEFVVPLVKAVQELSKANDDKDAKINTQQKEIEEMKAMILALQQNFATCMPCMQRSAINNQPPSSGSYKSEAANVATASLEQNIPNPFNHTTTINYTLSQKFTAAYIIITDKTGKTLKHLNISGSGRGSITEGASTLASGAYNYSLYVEGKLVGTKQMVVIK